MIDLSNNANRVNLLSPSAIIFLILFGLFGLSLTCQAAVTVDAVSSRNTGANTSLTLPISGDTWTHTVSGANTILIVGVAINQSNASESVSSVTFNGDALTRVGAAVRNNDVQTELWYQLAPDAGTYSIVVTLDSAARFVGGAISLNGVDQNTPLGTYAGTSGNSSSPSITVTSEEGGLVVDAMGYGTSNYTATAGAGQTQQWTQVTTNGTASNNARGYSSTEAGAASVTMSWTLSSGTKWAISAVPVIPYIDSFDYRKQITIDRTKVGVTGTANATLSNYPMLISVTDSDLRTTGYGGKLENPNGYDIMFRGVNDAVCGGAGTNPCTLSHQVEKYEPTTGELIAWVKLPSVNTNAAASNTTFYMYFGNASIESSLENATGVWDANFQAVWHMADNAANTTVVQSTSVTTPGNGVAAANTSTKATTGKISGALSFNGSSDYIYQSSATSLSNPQGYTLSAWVQTGTASGHKIIGFEGARTGTASTNYDRMLWIGTDGKAYAGCYNGAVYTAASISAVNDNSWHYLAAQITDSGYVLRMYIDGTVNNSTSVGGACENTTGYWRMGSYKLAGWTPGSDGYYAGNMDEVRISNTIRSADWIRTDYNSQSSPSTFYSIGSLEQSPITLVELKSFTATNYSGLVQLEWKTGYEIDNLGFRIYREGRRGLTRVTPSMVAGSALLASDHVALTSGRSYIWQDFAGDSEIPLRYWLEDIDTGGKSTFHGPITATEGEYELPRQVQSVVLSYLGKGSSKLQRHGSAWSHWSDSASSAKHPAAGARTTARKFSSFKNVAGRKLTIASNESNEPEDSSIPSNPASDAAVKILINRKGWYRLTQPQLVQAGLSPFADPAKLQLYVDGVQLPIKVFTCDGLGNSSTGQNSESTKKDTGISSSRDCEREFGQNAWIEFYGAGLDTPWTDTRAYYLVEGMQPGKRILDLDGSTQQSGIRSLPTTIEFRPKTVYWAGLLNGDDENFLGPVISFEGNEEILMLNHLNLLVSADGLLEVNLQGVTDTPHFVQVQVNGTVVGSLIFDGQSTGSGSFSFSSSLLVPGENRIRLIAFNGEEDISLIRYLRLSYERMLDADENSLQANVPGSQAITLGGFTEPAIRLIDVTDLLGPVEIKGAIVPQGNQYNVTFAIQESGARDLLAFTDVSIQTPAAVIPNQASAWAGAFAGADVVMISHADFIDSLLPLQAQHEAEGLTAAIVDVEDLYDEFSYGQKTPYALKSFLAKALQDWTGKPKYLVLVGDASFDPKNYLGLGDFDFLPTKLIDAGMLETASDDWFADFDDDGIPEIPVGRISARTPQEAASQVAKIAAYKQASASGGNVGDWAKHVVLVADRNDGFDFESSSDQLSDLVPASLYVLKIYRGLTDDTTARNQVLQSLNAGALLMNYLGHGSVELWRGDLLTSGDPAAFTNGIYLPLIISMNCLNGYFDDIYTESLAEALMKAPNGGAVGVWASSSLTDAQLQLTMNQELFAQLLHSSRTVGEAIIKAKMAVANREVRKTWIFFGDPTMRLPFTPDM
ncbi:MAG: DUF2341 domain-containing protein [Acidobacteria bacterium]|nr:DUF2341 domain-containing protein [Acidobacteriota bacterium]